MHRICRYVVLAMALLLFGTVVMASVIPAEKEHVVSLDGTWRFKLGQASTLNDRTQANDTRGKQKQVALSETMEPFYRTDYSEDAAWHDFKVPGNWEMAGYSPATYWQPDNTSGFFRKWIDIPASWAGRVVKVNFDGVQTGAEVWLNGQSVDVTEPSWGRSNYHESGWTAWQADLTPAVRFGERNLLALRVAKNTKSSDLDSGDYFYLGGVYRPVTLFSVPQAHIEDLTVQTRLLPDNKAEVKVIVAATKQASSVSMHIQGLGSMSNRLEDGKATMTLIVSKPKLWSAEHPNLYPLTVSLTDGGKTIESVTRRIGIREITIKNGILLVNGVPVKLTGICRHDVSAHAGTAVGPDLWRKDMMLMKAANINAIRTSHYPYGSGFYDLCDELGFYVADELPYCWAPVKDAALEPAFTQRARETIARDKNHPSVIIWAVGNENPDGVNNQTVADLVKALDSTRPRLVSCKKADLYGTEFDDQHYVNPERMQKDADDKERRAKWPFIYLENPNVWDVRFGADYGSLDRWAMVLKRVWDVTWASDGLPGSFLWEWQDRAVADKCPVKIYQYDQVTGIQYLKTKGLVDARRDPRADYYAVKMCYAPVAIGKTLDPATKLGTAVMDVANRYSFTDLAELNATWHLSKGGKAVGTGVTHLKLPALTKGKVALALSKTKMAGADTLRVDFDDPRGWNVVSYQFQLAEPKPTSNMDAALPKGLLFPKFNLVHNVLGPDGSGWRRITRYPGELINVKTEPEDTKPYYERPLSSIKTLDADIALAPGVTEPKGVVEDQKNKPQFGVPVGHVHAAFADGEFTYSVQWSGAKSDIQELGWAFELPKAYDHFSWQKQTLWSYYPETHIGRPTGTALPDSANVHLTDITRPDAFDFNSTKYDCDWASLTDASGAGVRVEFSSDQRHHVKGGFGDSAEYKLIVNKVATPPIDISSGCVKDFYTTLAPGDNIEGAFKVGSNKKLK